MKEGLNRVGLRQDDDQMETYLLKKGCYYWTAGSSLTSLFVVELSPVHAVGAGVCQDDVAGHQVGVDGQVIHARSEGGL